MVRALLAFPVVADGFGRAAFACFLGERHLVWRDRLAIDNGEANVALFERTTRSVHLTPAGQMLRAESGRLLGSVDQILQRIREDFAGAKKEIRVGVSRSVGLAYLPGFFHANLRRLPQVGYRVSYEERAGSSRRWRPMRPISASSARQPGSRKRCA